MTRIEIIDRFCDITSQQSDMIRKLVNVIAQSSNLLAYQLELQFGVENPELEWNATCDECTSWTFEDLSALAIAIKYHVKPFVAHQRKIEKDIIIHCVTIDEVNNVVINYNTIG